MLFPISEVKLFASGLDHPEGVAVGQDGVVFAGGEAGQVYRISADGKTVETIANTGGFCLSITLDTRDNIFICDCGKQAILEVTQGGKISVFADSLNGRKFVNPNFGVFDSKGSLYVTDSGDWKKANGVICRFDRNGRGQLFSEGPFHFPKGLALDAPESYLYVVESNLDRVLRIEVKADGAAGEPELYADGLRSVPDGLSFDGAGNLYVTTYGSSAIYRITPQRQVEMLCQDVENELLCLPTNCAFGGPNLDRLLVANLGHHHISILDLMTKGQPLSNQRARGIPA